MTSFEDQICSQLNDIPSDCVERSYWRRRLPPAFRFFLEILAHELLVSTPKNTFAHAAAFYEELLLQRDIELSLLPYDPYVEKLLQRNGLEPRYKSKRAPDSMEIRCAGCGGLVNTDKELQAQGDKTASPQGSDQAPAPSYNEYAPAYTPDPSYAPKQSPGPVYAPDEAIAPPYSNPPDYATNPISTAPKITKNPDFAVFSSVDSPFPPPSPQTTQPPSSSPYQPQSSSPYQPLCNKKCCHCGGMIVPAPKSTVPQPPEPQSQSCPPVETEPQFRPFVGQPSTSTKGPGPDFAFFGVVADDLVKPSSGLCASCGNPLNPDTDSVPPNQNMAGDWGQPTAKVEEEYPVYTIIPCTYEKDAWGRLMNGRGRRKDDDAYVELINSRSLSILMDY